MLGHGNVCAQTRKDYLFDQVAFERSIFEAYGIKCKLALSIVFIDLCVHYSLKLTIKVQFLLITVGEVEAKGKN